MAKSENHRNWLFSTLLLFVLVVSVAGYVTHAGNSHLESDALNLRKNAQDGTAVAQANAPVEQVGTGFEDHPVEPFEGEAATLRLQGEQRNFATRLNEAYSGPISFNGSMATTVIGCGKGCRWYYFLDKMNGNVVRFPLGGETNHHLNVLFRKGSSLIWAGWESEFFGCQVQRFNIVSGEFIALSEPQDIDCRTSDEIFLS